MASKNTIFISLVMSLCLFFFGCTLNRGMGLQDELGTIDSKNVYRGRVVSKSNRNKSFSVELASKGNVSIVTVYFDNKTRGIDHATRGKWVTVTCKVVKGITIAKSIKPEPAGFVSGVSEITVKKVKKMINDGDSFTLIDSRPVMEYNRSHLPSAISIPSCEMREHIDLLPEYKNQLLVFYSEGPTFGMSTMASATAAYAGYTNIRVMLAGVEGWIDAGYPTYADDYFVEKGVAILIDLRATEKNTAGRIAGSVSIPFTTLDERITDISKKSPIIIYSDSIQESLTALSSFRKAGFGTVSMVEGNFQGWKKRNKPITSGPVITEISWKRKTGKSEVSPAEFKKAMNNKREAVILDVRTSDETAAGKLKGAMLIPLNEIYDRSEELPKGKKIFIYSATGARAEMAGRLLRKNGYDAYFLVADVSCHAGDCQIEF